MPFILFLKTRFQFRIYFAFLLFRFPYHASVSETNLLKASTVRTSDSYLTAVPSGLILESTFIQWKTKIQCKQRLSLNFRVAFGKNLLTHSPWGTSSC